MKKLLFLSITVFTFLACSQNVEQDQTGENPNLVADIFSEIYYDQESDIYTYRNNEPVNGQYTKEFDDGSKHADLIFENGSIRSGQVMRGNGTHLTTYSTEGEIKIITSYYENENPSYRIAYLNDKSSPIEMRTWYENGTPSVQSTQSVAKIWHENGQLQSEVELVDGKMHGKGIQWHENGEIAAETYYKDDQWHGTFKKWDEEGNLISEREYDMGKPVAENME